jgi:hypothetical protein
VLALGRFPLRHSEAPQRFSVWRSAVLSGLSQELIDQELAFREQAQRLSM